MNFLNQYYTNSKSGFVTISAEQGSSFAKKVAGDFNPIHDIDSKRFCVPGDLLFGIAVNRYGLHQNMAIKFLSLINADTQLHYPEFQSDINNNHLQVTSNKPVLDVEYGGEYSLNEVQIEQLIKQYVAFSGHNFPDILVPLMQQHAVMINPKRPLVIYESMSLQFDNLDFKKLEINLEKTSLVVNGKRGDAKLYFSLSENGQTIGSGVKSLVLSGLREYEEQAVQQMCDQYQNSKTH